MKTRIIDGKEYKVIVIPSDDSYSNKDRYKSYIKSEIWKNKRKKILKRLKYKCVKCSSQKDLNIHHIDYRNLYKENKKDLVVLCRICHLAYHIMYKKICKKTFKRFLVDNIHKEHKIEELTDPMFAIKQGIDY